MNAPDDVTLQMMEHLRSLRLEVAALNDKIDAIAARLEVDSEGDPHAHGPRPPSRR